jgi:hypothetical protein
MFRVDDTFVFQRVTGCLRKPIVRFRMQSGRSVELLGFHLEPGWAFGGESPRPAMEEVARRVYPSERPVFIGEQEGSDKPAWLCLAYLYSDAPARESNFANYSVLLIGGLISNVDVGIRGIVCDLLSRVDWEAVATDDLLW